MKAWIRHFLAIVASGLMFQGALPPVGFGIFGWICFVPTLLVCRGRGFAIGFASGLGTVILASLLARYGLWCQPSLLDGDPGWIFAGFALFALPVGILHGVIGDSESTQWWTPLLLACWAVLLEAGLLLYLPAHLGLTQATNSLMLSLSSLTGIWGVSFLCWFSNLVLSETFVLKNRTGGIVALCAVSVISLGYLHHSKAITGRAVKVAAIQSLLEDSDYLVRSTRATKADIIVWPEAAGLGFQSLAKPHGLLELASRYSLPPFSTTYDDDNHPLPYNTMAVFWSGFQSQVYRKRKLFGGESATHRPGKVAQSVHVGDVEYGMNVCFDTCFPQVIRETAQLPQVGIILVPTLDPITPFGVCQAIHAAYTPFRAAEEGVAIVRADASGASMIVDQQGTIIAQSQSGTQEMLVATVGTESQPRFYKQLGDWFLVSCGFGALAGLVARLSRGVAKHTSDKVLQENELVPDGLNLGK